MRQTAFGLAASSRRARVVAVTVAFACAGLLVACSSASKSSARHASTTAHTASTTTSTAPTTAPKTTTASVAYRVKHGDRLTTIARRFHVSLPAIVFVNHITDPDRLTDGQVLRIPTHTPLTLIITPAKGPAGQRFELDLIGSKPSEVVKFAIDSPKGKETGPPHIAAKDGTVTTRYKTSPGDKAGAYNVTATGNKGTRVRASFIVLKGG